MKQVLKNHVAILLDTSASMHHLIDDVVKVFNKQIDFLRYSSLQFEQETRVSVYTFDSTVKCLISDVDVARPMTIGSLNAQGYTSLLDAVGTSLRDLKELPQRYGDHAFLIYLLTDGMENASRLHSERVFRDLPENYSLAAFVPDSNSVHFLINLGVPKGNIDKWDLSSSGIEEIGDKFEKTMTNYYTARSQGVKTSNTIFSDLNKVTVNDVKSLAKEVKKYKIIVNEDVKAIHIKPMVENKLGINYVTGCAFYELVKNEHVQEQKEIAVQDKKSGKVYKGYDARKLLGLPDVGKVKISPIDNKKWIIYVQSTSVNRNVIPKQRVLVIE